MITESCSQFELITVPSLESMVSHIQDRDLSKYWCFVDVDDSLIQTENPVFSWRNRHRYKAFKKELIPDEGVYPYIDTLICFDKARLMDAAIPEFIRDLQQRAPVVMTITAAMTGVFQEYKGDAIQDRHQSLRSFGMDFSLSSLIQDEIVLSNLEQSFFQYPMIRDGHIFCNLLNKGAVFAEFLKFLVERATPIASHILLIDDKEENLIDIADAVSVFNKDMSLDIKILAFHYTKKHSFDLPGCSKEAYLSAYQLYEAEAKRIRDARENML